jgi:ketosteroid isomerase-like protein
MAIAPEVLAQLHETNQLFCAAIRARDTSTFDRIFTPDALILPPAASPTQGIGAIQIFWNRAITALDVKDANLTTLTAEMAGDTIVEVGRCELILTDGLVVPGKYLVHWKCHEHIWKWSTDIWNMNQ